MTSLICTRCKTQNIVSANLMTSDFESRAENIMEIMWNDSSIKSKLLSLLLYDLTYLCQTKWQTFCILPKSIVRHKISSFLSFFCCHQHWTQHKVNYFMFTFCTHCYVRSLMKNIHNCCCCFLRPYSVIHCQVLALDFNLIRCRNVHFHFTPWTFSRKIFKYTQKSFLPFLIAFRGL